MYRTSQSDHALTSPLSPILRQSLQDLLGDRFSTHESVLQQHSHGESHHPPAPPAGVAFVSNETELTRLMQLCHLHDTPMVAFGAGTSVEGQVQALQGGICIDFSRMNRILEVNADDLNCVVEPGVTREQLNEHLRHMGLFFPVDPGANATIGGMVATNASGTTSLRYGGMKQNVLNLHALLASGEKIITGTSARKSSAGYHLTELLIGSEGTLALTTQIQLRLVGITESVIAARVGFDSTHQAVAAVIEMMQWGLPVARLELLDSCALHAVNRHCNTDYPERPTLFIEFHGSPQSTAEQVKYAAQFCAGQGATKFESAVDEEERKRMWHARHNAYYAALAQVPQGKGWVTDVCVPLSQLAACVEQTRADLEAENLSIPLVGHAGDGNFHLLFSIPPEDIQLQAKAEHINQRLVHRAHAMGGTCTGEHGIGIGKKASLLQEKGDSTVAVMLAIKKSLDPYNLLNPGKIF